VGTHLQVVALFGEEPQAAVDVELGLLARREQLTAEAEAVKRDCISAVQVFLNHLHRARMKHARQVVGPHTDLVVQVVYAVLLVLRLREAAAAGGSSRGRQARGRLGRVGRCVVLLKFLQVLVLGRRRGLVALDPCRAGGWQTDVMR